jgi:hypothetical protein
MELTCFECSVFGTCALDYGKLFFSLGMLDPVYEGAACPNTWRNIPEDLKRRAAATCCVTFRRRSKRSGWAPSFTPLRQSPLEG